MTDIDYDFEFVDHEGHKLTTADPCSSAYLIGLGAESADGSRGYVDLTYKAAVELRDHLSKLIGDKPSAGTATIKVDIQPTFDVSHLEGLLDAFKQANREARR